MKDTGRLRNEKYIGLEPDQVRVYYTKYVNDYKPQLKPLQPGQTSICDAINDQLTPGTLVFEYVKFSNLNLVGSVDFNGSAHAMVLDTMDENDEFMNDD